VSVGPADLAPLISPDLPQTVGFRQGVVVAWDQETAANTILVAGATLTNVPIINSFEALSLEAGDVVGLLTFGSTWFVLGRITVPGAGQAATALNALSDRTVSATIPASEATASATFTALATAGPAVTVPVPTSARVLVLVTARISGTAFGGEMGFTVSGASTIAAASTSALQFQAPGAGVLAATFLARLTAADGLAAGVNVFTAQYRAASGTATFSDRNITVATI
jgi:hypothetical protein